MNKIRITHERRFSPHHTLICAARMALDSAEKKMSGWSSHRLICITFSALAVEALANAIGERIVPDWEDFEAVSPVGKLRIICEKQKILIDWQKEPWSGIQWLVGFRNRVVHAKPQAITEKLVVPEQGYEKDLYKMPQSKLEAELTAGNAHRAIDAFDTLLIILCDSLRIDQKIGISSDISKGNAEPYGEG
jgi:hypothetical protein